MRGYLERRVLVEIIHGEIKRITQEVLRPILVVYSDDNSFRSSRVV